MTPLMSDRASICLVWILFSLCDVCESSAVFVAAQAPSAPDAYHGFLLPGALGGAAVGDDPVGAGDGDFGSDEGIKV